MLSGASSIFTALKIAAISMPTLLLYIAPISVLCAIIYTYYILYTDSEMIVMESSGLSKKNIARPAIRFASVITLGCYLLTFFVVPLAKKQLSNYIEFIKNNIELSSVIEEKSFTRISKNITLYVNSKGQNNTLHGIAMYNKEYNGSTTFILAKSAELIDRGDTVFFKLFDGNRQSTNNANLQILYFNELKFDIPKRSFIKTSPRKPNLEEQNVISLLLNYHNNPSTKDVTTELNQRLIWPLLNLAIAYIGISASFSRYFQRKWSIYKIAYASLASIALFGSVILLSRKSSDHLIYIILMYAIPLIVCLISIHLIKSDSENQNSAFSKMWDFLRLTQKKNA